MERQRERRESKDSGGVLLAPGMIEKYVENLVPEKVREMNERVADLDTYIDVNQDPGPLFFNDNVSVVEPEMVYDFSDVPVVEERQVNEAEYRQLQQEQDVSHQVQIQKLLTGKSKGRTFNQLQKGLRIEKSRLFVNLLQL